MLDKGSTAIKAALNELDAAGLLVRERRGFSAPNRLYVKITQMPVVQFSDHMTAIQPENRPSDSRKSDPHKGGKPTFALDGKPTPNQLTINQLKENQRKGVSGEQPAPFGRYKNLFLSESEYAELKGEYPDRLERFIEELSEYIAAYGKVYANMPPLSVCGQNVTGKAQERKESPIIPTRRARAFDRIDTTPRKQGVKDHEQGGRFYE